MNFRKLQWQAISNRNAVRPILVTCMTDMYTDVEDGKIRFMSRPVLIPDGFFPPDDGGFKTSNGFSFIDPDEFTYECFGYVGVRFGNTDLKFSCYDEPVTDGYFITDGPNFIHEFISARIGWICRRMKMDESAAARIIDYSALQLDVNWPFAAKRGKTSGITT